MALELEDDVFFADLSKRIALLIMDDDDDGGSGGGEAAFRAEQPSVSLQAFSQASRPVPPCQLFYEQAYNREVRGTGVFIPLSSPARSKKKRNRRPRHAHKSKATVPAMAATTNSCS